MQLFLLILLIALVISLAMLVFAMLMALAVALAIGIPVYLLVRHFLASRKPAGITQKPLERLQNLYVDGKIDLFEFERRVAHLVSTEH